MASDSVSSIKMSFKYEVFLSFRGEDTRKTFVDHLYHALVKKGIKTYKDDVKIEKGERISNQLIRSIQDSRFYIIVFSKNYASSSWCLDELVKIMECQKTKGQTAYPIFYDVEPTEVRKQSGAVEKAFAEHLEEEGARRWRDALKEAANLAGWELKNTVDGHEAPFIQKIVQHISLKLHFINFTEDENLEGMESRVGKIVSSLEPSSDDDVRIIGIKGIGGGGKTILAKAVFDQISILFEGKSFVEIDKGSSLKELQKQVLSDVSNDQSIVVTNVSDGKTKMRSTMGSTKVLVVLDDVNHLTQLQALANPSWFKPGSRIIITTRDERVLEEHRLHVNNIHDVNLLSNEEATRMFSRYAFGREVPDQGYAERSGEVVRYADGLPLAIKILGSDFYGRDEAEWVDTIKRLPKFPPKEIMEKLEFSYDSLDRDCQQMFLDVACILKGERKEDAIRILESCGYQAIKGLKTLKEKSFITISNDGRLLLNRCIEEMGWDIVRRVDHNEPSRHSRLWIKEEIEDILRDRSGTEATISIKLQNTSLTPEEIMNGLSEMKKLKFIFVDNGTKNVECSFRDAILPKDLRYLYWRNYPSCCLPPTFHAQNLVNLEMVGSKISQIWEGEEQKPLNKLRFIDLNGSKKLETFDLEMTQNLETLDLGECNDFLKVHMHIILPKLKFLNLRCSNVSNLNLRSTPNLEKLTLSIEGIQDFPDGICLLTRLKYLELTSCWLLKELPQDISNLKCLEKLYLTDCEVLQYIPDSICKMKSLKFLHLPYIRVNKLPDELGLLENLKELNIEGASISHLPESIIQKKGLYISWSKGRLKSYGFASFQKSTRYTASCYV